MADGFPDFQHGNRQEGRRAHPVHLARRLGRRVAADESINFNAYRASNHPLIVPTGRAPIYVMLDVLFALLARNCDRAAMQNP